MNTAALVCVLCCVGLTATQPPAGIEALLDELLAAESPSSQVESRPPPSPPPPQPRSPYWRTSGLADEASIGSVDQAQQWLDGYLVEAETILHSATLSGWNYFTNLTDYNRGMLIKAEDELEVFLRATALQAKQFDLTALHSNATLQRLLHMLSMEGLGVLSSDDLQQYSSVKGEMASVFGNAAVCEEDKAPPCTLGYADIQPIMATSRDSRQLLYLWKTWRDRVGPALRPAYQELVRLSNLGANLNGFEDAGALWRSPFEMAAPTLARGPQLDLQAVLDGLYDDVLPLYQELHAYVRRRLAGIFEPNREPQLTSDGPIPAHLLGSLTADDWSALFFDTQPFQLAESSFEFNPWSAADPVGLELQRMNFTALKLFQQAETFYTGMDLAQLPESFWSDSVFSRQWNRNMLCHPPTAFDLRDAAQYRVKMCAQVTQPDFTEAHKLLAQSHYQHSYRHLPLPFREAANPSFSQAIGDALGLASQSRPYLRSLGVDVADEKQTERINRLYQEALRSVVALPYTLAVDSWRWSVFAAPANDSDWDDSWWRLRRHLQGVVAPVPRSAADFDAAANPLLTQQHFPAVKSFISYVMQFQLLKSLCQAAGYAGPLNVTECDINGSAEAGAAMRRLMELGSSQPWTDALAAATGDAQLRADALLDYFRPLHDWLAAENRRAGAAVGWHGPGTPFDELGSEETQLGGDKTVSDNSTDERLTAMAGEPCDAGQTCLHGSECDGAVCACAEGMAAWQQHCLPKNPAAGDSTDGFHVNIVAASTVAPEPEAEPEPTKASTRNSLTLSTLLLTLIRCFLS